MEDKIIDIIYDSIKDKNFYNYDNGEDLKVIKQDILDTIDELESE